MPRLPWKPPLCQVLFNTTTNQIWWKYLSQWDSKPTDSLSWQNALGRVKNGQLQATGNPALINKMSYSQKEEINSSSPNWEDRREHNCGMGITEFTVSLFLQNVVPVCYVFRLQKEWGSGGTAQREGLYQKLSTTTVIKEAARAHTTKAAAKVKWKHFLFSAVAPKDNKRWFYYAKWGAAGTPFLDGSPPIFPKLYTVGKQQVTVPKCAFKAHACTPHWLQPPGKANRKTGGPPTTMVTMEVAPAELCPQPVGCSGTAWFRLMKQRHWIFLPLPSAMGFTTAPQHSHHQWELPHSEEPHPTFLLRAAAFRGSLVSWQRPLFMAHQHSALLAADSNGGGCPCRSRCWQSQGGWYGSSQPWDTRLSLQKLVCRFPFRRERSRSEIACIFLNSFIAWRLPFILPPGSVCIAGILSQSYIIIPRSPQATACQWRPQSLARQPGHMKSYTRRFNTFSWPQTLFLWIPCSVFLIRCQGSFALSRVLRRWLFSCSISRVFELSLS